MNAKKRKSMTQPLIESYNLSDPRTKSESHPLPILHDSFPISLNPSSKHTRSTMIITLVRFTIIPTYTRRISNRPRESIALNGPFQLTPDRQQGPRNG